VLEEIQKLNEDSKIGGIFIQLPLPDHIDETNVLNAVRPEKDVDGFHPLNVGKAWLGQDAFLPATPIGIYEMLLRSGIQIEGKDVAIVNVDSLVGKPLASILVKEGANVTLCQPSTPGLTSYTSRADILVVSVNSPKLIKAEMVKDGAVVIDFGFNYIDGKSVGDVDFDSVEGKAKAITPVPGGVGPMTVTMLLANTVKACEMGRL
jgi:methylenetetrahydrofolate dehydrogenase (NADP+)/methenyltetrahydrofolate cyclohydrolase